MSDDKRRLAEAEAQLARQEREENRRRESTGPSSNGGSSSGNGSRSGPGGNPQEVLEKPPSRMLVFATVTFYLIAAIVMVFVNKAVLNAVSVPLFFLFGQLIIAVLLLHLSALVGYFTLPAIQVSTCKALAPLITINVLGLSFNTYCLQYVDASFYQVARGLILPFTVLASYLILHSKSSPRVLVGVVIVCFGFLYGVNSERLTVSHLGVALGVFSSMTTSVHAIIVKRSLSVVPGAVELAYYTNLLSALVILPFTLLAGEIPTLMDIFLNGGSGLRTFLLGTIVTGIFGFLICIAGFLSIKVTSPVTHMVSSAVRGVLQTALGAWVFGDVITTGRLGGIFFILVGSLFYTWVKDQEMSQAKAQYNAATTPRIPMDQVRASEAEQYELTINEDMDDDDKELAAAARAVGSPTSPR